MKDLLNNIPLNTKICLVAGEVSGDQLGAGLVAQLKTYRPDLQFVGIGGDLMRAQGVDTWYDISELSYFGVVDVVLSLPKILRVISRTKARLKESGAQLYIGIDNPDFNLRLETYAKESLGIKTIHYVSPSVWAWRQGRIETIKKACDLVLCLLPFEKDFYDQHQQPAAFVGHRLANTLGASLQLDAQAYQELLINTAQQRLNTLSNGQVWVSQAKRLMEASQEPLSDSEFIALQNQPRDALSGSKIVADLEEQAQTANENQEQAKPEEATLAAQPEKSTQASQEEQTSASQTSTQPEEPTPATKAELTLSAGSQNLALGFKDLVLGVDGKYYLSLTPEQVDNLKAQAKKVESVSKKVEKATAEVEKATVEVEVKEPTLATPDFIVNSQRLQAFVNNLPSAQQALAKLQAQVELEVNQVKVAILPGSRSAEIDLIFPWYLSGIRKAIQEKLLPEQVELLVPVAKAKLKDQLIAVAADYKDLNLKFIDGHAHQVLQSAVFALVSSGTATLDTLLCHTPMLVGYRLSGLNFFLAKRLIKTPYVALANVIMGQEFAKELIQDDLTAANIVSQLKPLLDVNYNLNIRQVYFFEHLRLQKDSDKLAAQATLALLAGDLEAATLTQGEQASSDSEPVSSDSEPVSSDQEPASAESAPEQLKAPTSN
ncbi:hypothetical protein CJP74_01485 [Psittacicella melopsittaci]|uniref:Lipid-A-disaccharide synthase n=1 Tax=Psittacicella melopsittaci TaxID=2028576 RepID=A0A3A1YBH6_9GAMM|nr:hypothetical protein [Psittacicella melopsittaci]RIY33564.1 hypothetical protein CJP74_01485 [Psittacicella melopsittaci]